MRAPRCRRRPPAGGRHAAAGPAGARRRHRRAHRPHRRIRREVLPDALRITLELEREVPFHDETPRRHRHACSSTCRTPGAVASAEGRDRPAVRRRRGPPAFASAGSVGLAHARRPRPDVRRPRYSVYTLYNPYRVVIDFERAAGDRAAPRAAPRRLPHRRATVAARSRADRRRRCRRSAAVAPAAPPATVAANTERRLLAVAAARARRRAHRHRSRTRRSRPGRHRREG